MGTAAQSLGGCGRRHARGLHGDSRYDDRQCRAAAHRRQSVVEQRRSDWALTSYLVANGIVLTISGWLGSLLGRKRYFMICLAMFTVCSFLCGIATSLPQLILFRLLQGFFGGGLQPNQQSIILDYFPPAKRSAAFGLTAIATIVGPVLGPTLGGLITDSTFLALDFLRQRTRRHRRRDPRLHSGSGPALGEARAAADRRHRPRSHRARSRLSRSDDGSRRGRGLVQLELHRHHGDAVGHRPRRLGAFGSPSPRSRSSILPSSGTRILPAAAS